MNVQNEAIIRHDSGFNCAQSVLLACREYCPALDEKELAAISAGFGGGARCGELCGAVSGALMAIGLANPFCDAEDNDAKDKIAALAKEFTGRFAEERGGLRCAELKIDKPACEELIRYAAALAEKMRLDNKKQAR